MWTMVRYRPGQALIIVLLTALVVACAVFSTLFVRATEQALVHVELTQAPVQESGLSLSMPSRVIDESSSRALMALVPPSSRSLFGDPVVGATGVVGVLPGQPSDPTGLMVWRDDFCAHVQVVAGRCASAAGDVMISEKDAEVFGYAPGVTVRFGGGPSGGSAPARIGRLRVVGVYRQPESSYWFGQRLTGLSGLYDQSSVPRVQHDAWLTDEATFAAGGAGATRPSDVSATLTLALDTSRVGVDELADVGPAIRRVLDRADGGDLTAASGLPDIAAEVARQRDQSGVTVPLLMVQLALLVLVVYWLVLDLLSEQRRPELALALLHGRGRRGARRRLADELVPAVIGGTVVGTVVASAAGAASARWFLPGEVGIEWRTAPWVAAAGSLLLLILVTGVAARRVTRAPVQSLLRTVGTRRRGWGFGAIEATLLVACGISVVAFVFDWLSGPLAVAGPMLLALLVGLLLAHLIVPVAGVAGGRLLRGGRLRLGLSVLGAARGPSARRTVAIITVASALLVFSADALTVGSRNRAAAAAQQAGAPLVADVDTTDLDAVRRALAAVDPGGRAVSPVVRVPAVNAYGTQTLAVVPAAFSAIALAPGGSALDLGALARPDIAPVEVTGTRISGAVVTSALTAKGSRPPTVSLVLDSDTEGRSVVLLGELETGTGRSPVDVALPCAAGCRLTGVRLDTTPGGWLSGGVTLSGLAVDGRPLALGASEDWYGPRVEAADSGGVRSPRPPATITVGAGGSDLAVEVARSGGSSVTVGQAWIPPALPAVVAGSLAGGPSDGTITVAGLDGVSREAYRAATATSVPASPANTVIVDLDDAERGVQVASVATVSVWFAADDPALLARTTQALADAGVTVTDTRTLVDAQRLQDQSLAAWSLQLAAAVAAACLLLAVLVLLVVAAATSRARSRDLASLTMAGVHPRSIRMIATLEPVFAVVIAVVAGATCGLVGAQIALPDVPLLTQRPDAFALDISPAWVAVLATAAGALVVLGVVAYATGIATARRADLTRLRENVG